MRFKKKTLSNSLRVVSIPMTNLESACLTVWIGVGSRYEKNNENGLSHFLEHMAFKGSKKRPSAQEISETIDSMGAENNAATSKEWTNFYIKVRADLIEKAFGVLSDMLINPIIKNEDIERERGVILEEIAMEEDTPIEKIGDVFMETVYGGSPLGRSISGTVNSVSKINKDDFLRYRMMHYGSRNMVVTVAGGVTSDKAFDLAEKYFSNLINKKKEEVITYKGKHKKPQLNISYKNSEQAHFILGFLGYPRNHRSRYAESVLATILGSGMSSRLFNEIREKRGLAYSVNTSTSHYVDTGVFATYAGVDVKRIDEAISVMLDQKYGIGNGKHPITKKELEKAKEYIKGRMALALEDTNSVNGFFGIRALFLDKIETPEDVFEKIDKVTIEQVTKVAQQLFVPEKLNLAVIGPYKNEKRFEKLIK